ncbi:MAG TPA: C4-type zinc ribbon domain-containing protein [Ignavibacteriales bacterium]|nr:C4-type zinc ribbon domain-containing protein [Ignavibacteriales bacterium]HRR19063.1 C4-type zinc ribbon domain-containing protein [Ignavibacteriales bacterium]
MITRLKNLYHLQLIDNELDKLEEFRGDLPQKINELEAEVNSLKYQIEEKKLLKERSKKKINDNENEIEELKENQKKYKSQLTTVRTNREYDALTKQIDAAEDKITALTNEISTLENTIETLKSEIAELTKEFENKQAEISEAQANLNNIVEEYSKEEARLLKLREEVLKSVHKGDLSLYSRIRKSKGGLAISTVVGGACSGCYNKIPSQKLTEIRINTRRMFTCEQCGRIIVSADLADEVKSNVKL